VNICQVQLYGHPEETLHTTTGRGLMADDILGEVKLASSNKGRPVRALDDASRGRIEIHIKYVKSR